MALPSLPYTWPFTWLSHWSCSSGLECPCHFGSCSPRPRSAAPEPRDYALLHPWHFLSVVEPGPGWMEAAPPWASSLPQHPPQHLLWRALRWPKVEGYFISSIQPFFLSSHETPVLQWKCLVTFLFKKIQLDYPVLIGPVCLASVWPFSIDIWHCSTWTNFPGMFPSCLCVFPHLTQTMFLLPGCPLSAHLAGCSIADDTAVLTHAVSCTQAHCEPVALKSPLHYIILFISLFYMVCDIRSLDTPCAPLGFNFYFHEWPRIPVGWKQYAKLISTT